MAKVQFVTADNRLEIAVNVHLNCASHAPKDQSGQPIHTGK